MKRYAMVLVFLSVVAMPAAAQQYCMKCYEPPDGQAVCDTTIFNGAGYCQTESTYNGCETWGGCQGSGGDECGWPHCIPERWTCATPLPEKGRWVATGATIARAGSSDRVATEARTKS